MKNLVSTVGFTKYDSWGSQQKDLISASQQVWHGSSARAHKRESLPCVTLPVLILVLSCCQSTLPSASPQGINEVA